MEKFTEFIKKILGLKAEEGSGEGAGKGPLWKRINMLMVIGAAGIMMMVLANLFAPGGGQQTDTETETGQAVKRTENQAVTGGAPQDIPTLENNMAGKLEDILSQINGVGEVKVTVNLASTPEKDFAVNSSVDTKNTEERDQRGGNRTITETNEQDQMVLVRENQGSNEDPVVVKEKKPEVKGVVVVADGVGDPLTKANVMKAVQVYLDVPLYRVIVLEKESR